MGRLGQIPPLCGAAAPIIEVQMNVVPADTDNAEWIGSVCNENVLIGVS